VHRDDAAALGLKTEKFHDRLGLGLLKVSRRTAVESVAVRRTGSPSYAL